MENIELMRIQYYLIFFFLVCREVKASTFSVASTEFFFKSHSFYRSSCKIAKKIHCSFCAFQAEGLILVYHYNTCQKLSRQIKCAACGTYNANFRNGVKVLAECADRTCVHWSRVQQTKMVDLDKKPPIKKQWKIKIKK